MPSPVDKIKEQLDIVQVIGQTVQLKRAGRTYKGLCPFHNEKTPSFVVFPETQSYYCFGCGEAGDIITFTMKRQGLAFREALETLARAAGISLQSVESRPKGNQDRLLGLLTSAALFYQQRLASDPEAQLAISFLSSKSLSKSTWEVFGLGYAPKDSTMLVQHLRDRGFSEPEMIAAGVLTEGATGLRDRFRGRLVIPIRDRTGQVRGFSGRSLDGSEPKYLNSPQTELFDKGSLLFGIDLAAEEIRRSGTAVIVEGYTDVMAAFQAGARNVVATMGTALTLNQARQLGRLASRIVLALDADAAGATAAIKDIDALRRSLGKERLSVGWGGVLLHSQQLEVEIKVAQLPPGKDPDDIIRDGLTQWEEIVSQAQDLVDYCIDHYVKVADLASARGKSQVVQQLKPVLRAIRDPVAREHYVTVLASRIGVPPSAIHQALRGRDTTPTDLPDHHQRDSSKLSAEDYLLAFLLRYPEALQLEHDISPEDFPRADDRLIFGVLSRAVYNEPNLDTQRILDLMDDTLKDRASHLASAMAAQPDLDRASLDRALKIEVTRHRAHCLRARLEQNRFALAAAEEEGDAEVVARIAAEIRQLATKLAGIRPIPRGKAS